MKILEQAAVHARVVEDRLRRDFREYKLLIEIEVSVEGFVVKAVAGDEEKVFSDRRVVPFDCVECLIASIDESEHRMREKMKSQRRIIS